MKIISNVDQVEYVSLDNDGNLDIKRIFWYLNSVYNCTYMTYMIDVKGVKKFFSTNDNWSTFFIKEGLINVCPIYRNAFQAIESGKKCVFSAWDFVDHKPGVETEVKELRRYYGLDHGFGMAMQRGDVKEALCFGSTPQHDKFHTNMSERGVVAKTLSVFRHGLS